MRILLAQINPTIGDLDGNLKLIQSAIDAARSSSCDLVITPELALTGYPPEDFLLLPRFIEDVQKCLDTIIETSQGLAVVVGLPRRNPDKTEKILRNSAAVIENQTLLGYQDKTLLPTYDVFDERRYFEPGNTSRLWTLCGKKIAITICEDIWQQSDLIKDTCYRKNPVQELSVLTPELALNLSASPFSVSKIPNRLSTVQQAAKIMKCPFLYCNQVGGNDSLIFDGYSFYVGADGSLLDYAAGFKEEHFIVDLEATTPPCLAIEREPIDDLYQALILGVRDYFRKSGFQKACLGLSGGIDSALVACIASAALGKEHVLGVMMPSRYSSEGSILDARLLAKNLGIPTCEIPIEEPFESFLDLLETPFQGKRPDVTEENLQARIRGIILMALSNKHGYILLSTGNKSELAMGYSTLYGDMCGGLSVINDVTKRQVYELAHWINRFQEVIPGSTIEKPPSAELRPGQKDSDTLPPYEVLDTIVQDYVEDHLDAASIAEKHGYSLDLVKDVLVRIHRNEYKRRQSPPGLRISEKAFSVGRRFPIVQKYIC
jgi:NAD+ synthase (glutamine-hydrolysing)